MYTSLVAFSVGITIDSIAFLNNSPTVVYLGFSLSNLKHIAISFPIVAVFHRMDLNLCHHICIIIFDGSQFIRSRSVNLNIALVK